jgi:hypothetical protein
LHGDQRSLVDQLDTIVATHRGIEIRCRGEESGIRLLQVRLPPADAAHPRRDRVEDQGLEFFARQEGLPPGRAGLMAAQSLGITLCRFVLRLPPVVATGSEDLVEWLGPTLQRYAL